MPIVIFFLIKYSSSLVNNLWTELFTFLYLLNFGFFSSITLGNHKFYMMKMAGEINSNSPNWSSLFFFKNGPQGGQGGASGGNGQGSSQQVQTGASGGNGRGDYFTPQGNQPWPQGTKQENLHPDYMRERGYCLNLDGDYEILENDWSWGWNTANFCEDDYNEAKANSDKKHVRTHIPIGKLCEKDARHLGEVVEERGNKHKNTVYNTENNREILRDLPKED